jgi:hypothetical protein
VPFFVPSTNQHASLDPSSIHLPKATFTWLWNRVGVGDMAFKGGYIFISWPTFHIKGTSCGVIPSLKGLLFRLRGHVVNTSNPIFRWIYINPLTLVSWPKPTHNQARYPYTHSLLYSSTVNCIQALSSALELGIHKPTLTLYSTFLRCIQDLSNVF